jgi:hypothetical protein
MTMCSNSSKLKKIFRSVCSGWPPTRVSVWPFDLWLEHYGCCQGNKAINVLSFSIGLNGNICVAICFGKKICIVVIFF